MRRCAELERIVEAAELLFDHFPRIARDFERLLHDVDAVVADGSGGKLDAVAHHVVLVRFDFQRRLRVQRFKPALRHGERVVREDNLAGLGILLVEREVHNPAEAVAIVFADVVRHVVGDIRADKAGEAVAFLHRRGHEEERVAGFHLDDGLHLFELFRCEELGDGALELAFLRPGNIAQALAAVLLHVVFALVEPSAGLHAHDTLHEQALHKAALFNGVGERLEACAAEEVAHIHPLERVAKVRLVGAVCHHGVAVLDARPRGGRAIPLGERGEGLSDHVFDDCEDFVLGGVAHFDVELVELARGTVGAGGFVAEARRNLEVAVEARNHEKLLEHLRRLRQSVELAAMDAARHQIVARTFRRGCRENRRLELVETLRPHLFAQKAYDLRAQNDVVVQLFAPQIEVAVLQAHVLGFVGFLVRHVNWGDGGGGFHHELVRFDFDFARGKIGVDGVGGAELHLARHGDDALQMSLLHKTEEGSRGVHYNLRETVMIPEVDEKDAAMVSEAVHPAGKANGFACV